MRPCSAALGTLLFLHLSKPAVAQRVLIRHAARAAVVDVLKTYLLPQAFKFESADDKAALFSLDRGIVVQQGGHGTSHVMLELRVRFKPESQDLEVTAWEEVFDVGFPTTRRTVRSRAELDNLQHLLDKVKDDLEAHPGPTVKRDSSEQ